MDRENALQTTKAIEVLNINLATSQITNALRLEKPPANIVLLRVATLRAKLNRAQRLVAVLEELLK
jgi:hypothetical protein